ncbi:Pathogenesis-related protein 1A [Hordeum vulgare]|nr:Pathogenesis-related protein 1A [Hordeum vulgare]
MAPGGLALLLLLALLALVDALAALNIDITASIFHSHDHLGGNKKQQEKEKPPSSSEKEKEKEKPPSSSSWSSSSSSSSSSLKVDADYFAAAAKKGLHSFTGGRGNYKAMAKEFLEAHNRVRAKYGVPPLRWSNKLSRYARRWSAARRFDCVMMHSVGSPYGENVFWGTGWDWRAVDAVGDWASEASFYDWRAQACHPGQVCEHFTAIVWRTTKYVGCGRAECLAGGVFITCSYDPPGNWKGEVPLT